MAQQRGGNILTLPEDWETVEAHQWFIDDYKIEYQEGGEYFVFQYTILDWKHKGWDQAFWAYVYDDEGKVACFPTLDEAKVFVLDLIP